MWDALTGAHRQSPLPNIPDLARLFKSECFQGSFSEFLQIKVTAEVREEIFQNTKQQAQCPVWKQQRLGALTASILHRAARYKGNDSGNYVVQEIMGTSKFHGNIATAYGLQNEAIAKKLYAKLMEKEHQQCKVISSGLLINSDNPLLRASPDGLVSCRCCGQGVLEIKCPFSNPWKTMTGEEIARKGNYHLKLGENNDVQLKRTSPWYTQIQTQMAVAQYSWCDFVVFTQKKPHITVERILYDKAYFENVCQKAVNFYDRFV